MYRMCVQTTFLALLLFPTWTSVNAIEVPLKGLELVPFTAPQTEPIHLPPPQPDEAVREKDTPRRLPFLYDVMPEADERDDFEPPRADVLDIRGA